MDKLNIFCFLIVFSFFSNALSHHKSYSPRIEEGRVSMEWRGHFNLDEESEKNKEHHHVLESEYSWTRFWQSEIELHISDKSNTPLDWEKTEFQNQVQIYDSILFAAALYFSYNFVTQSDKGDEIEYKFLSEFNNKLFNFTTNVIFEKQVGHPASGSTEFSLSNYLLFEKPIFRELRFGIIGFSEFGEVSKMNTYHNQEHQYGFQLENEFLFNNTEIEWVIGYLNGLTNASSSHALLWNIELEF